MSKTFITRHINGSLFVEIHPSDDNKSIVFYRLVRQGTPISVNPEEMREIQRVAKLAEKAEWNELNK